MSCARTMPHGLALAASAEDARLDRRPAHEGEVGAGLADIPETGDDFFALEYVPGAFGIARRFDTQFGFPISVMAVQEITGRPVNDGQDAGTQNGAAAMFARFDQKWDFQGSDRAANPADDIVLFQPGFAGKRVAKNQANLSFVGPTGLQNLGGPGIGTWIEVRRARQRRLAPGLDGMAILLVTSESGIVLVREGEVGSAQFVGNQVGVVAGVGKAEAGIALAAIDDIELLFGIDADLVHLGFLSTWRGTQHPMGVSPTGVLVGSPVRSMAGVSLRGNSGRLCYRPEHLLNDHVIGDDDLVGYQTVQFQQQGVRVVLVIRAQGGT